MLTKLRVTLKGTIFARLWHKYAPSFTVWRKVWGIKMFMDFRDNVDEWQKSGEELEERDRLCLDALKDEPVIWDVGCNIGQTAIPLALSGSKVYAFDISMKAICLLANTCRANNINNIHWLSKGLTVEEECYTEPKTSNTANSMRKGGYMLSWSYKKAEEFYGIPTAIKMDIEGGEEEFLKSKEFKKWVDDNKIKLFVEIHDTWDYVWKNSVIDGKWMIYNLRSKTE